MEEKETVNNYAMRITRLLNQVTTHGETITEKYIVVKILRSLKVRLDTIVVAIEESNDLAATRKKELQSSLKAHE